MGILARLGIGNVGDMFSKIVGTFKLSPEKAAELESLREANEVALQKMQIELEKNAQDAVSREIEAASANIRAEANTGDKVTQRARPTFLYLCYAVMAFAFIVCPLISLLKYGTMEVLKLPDMFYWLFGSGYLGYSGFREVGKFMALPGASELKLPFNIRMANDSTETK